jgi:cell shape-determining protein MreD
MDIFSSGPTGLSALIYLVVFLGIYLGSLFFNFQTVKGQIIIILLAVLLKNAMGQGVTALLFGNSVFSRSIFFARAVSIIGTGLLTPVLYAIFDRLGRGPGRKEEASALEVLKDPTWEEDHY